MAQINQDKVLILKLNRKLVICSLILIVLLIFIINFFIIGRGLTVTVINNSNYNIERLSFGGRGTDDEDKLDLFNISSGDTVRGYKYMTLDGIAMFYKNSNGHDEFIPVGYMYGYYQKYSLIIEINEIIDGVIVEYTIYNMDTTPFVERLLMNVRIRVHMIFNWHQVHAHL